VGTVRKRGARKIDSPERVPAFRTDADPFLILKFENAFGIEGVESPDGSPLDTGNLKAHRIDRGLLREQRENRHGKDKQDRAHASHFWKMVR
jgi:hypothetical protein